MSKPWARRVFPDPLTDVIFAFCVDVAAPSKFLRGTSNFCGSLADYLREHGFAVPAACPYCGPECSEKHAREKVCNKTAADYFEELNEKTCDAPDHVHVRSGSRLDCGACVFHALHVAMADTEALYRERYEEAEAQLKRVMHENAILRKRLGHL